MAVKLKSFLRNQKLKLASKGLILSFLIFLAKYDPRPLTSFLLVMALAVFYFRPAVNNGKYMPEILLALLGVSYFPASLGTTGIFFASLYFAVILVLFIGLKSLSFIDRRQVEFWARLLLIAAYNGLYFLGMGGYSFSVIVFFAITLFIFKNFTPVLNDNHRIRLLGAVLALVMVQMNWAISLSFLDVFQKIVFSSAVLAFLAIVIWRYMDGGFKLRTLFPEKLISWAK